MKKCVLIEYQTFLFDCGDTQAVNLKIIHTEKLNVIKQEQISGPSRFFV